MQTDETRRRVAMLRHAGGFLRAFAGDSPRIAAMVAREIGGALQRAAVNAEGRSKGVEGVGWFASSRVASGGEA